MVVSTLVGENARLENDVYYDDFMSVLNELVTVDEVLGEQREAIAKGETTPVANLVMGTLGVCEHENHLVSLVMEAARAGEWRAVSRGEGQIYGLDSVVEKGFGYVTEHEGKKYLLPSVHYIEHCRRQIK